MKGFGIFDLIGTFATFGAMVGALVISDTECKDKDKK